MVIECTHSTQYYVSRIASSKLLPMVWVPSEVQNAKYVLVLLDHTPDHLRYSSFGDVLIET